MRDLKFAVCIMAVLGTLTALAPSVQSQVHSGGNLRPAGICGSPRLSDPRVLSDAISNTAARSPETYRLMRQRAAETVLTLAEDTVGMEHDFFVYNFNTRSFYSVKATLMSKGVLAEIWVDRTEISNGHVDSNVVSSIKDALENRTPEGSKNPEKGIIALEEEYLGMPPNSGYSNGFIHFLITDIKDDWDSTNSSSSYIAGFFLSNDQPNLIGGSYSYGSNKRDLLYIDSYPGIYFGGKRNPHEPLPTLAHEFQHLIHWHYDSGEITFLNEGCSMNAEILCGYPMRSPSSYFSNTDVSLFTWRESNSTDVLADYARSAIFMRYLSEQFGSGFLRQFIGNPLRGIDGINSTLALLGSSLDFTQVFRSWTIANALNDTSSGRQYGYIYPIAARPLPVRTFNDPNVCLAHDTTTSLAVEYVAFGNGDSLIVSYNSTGLEVSAIESGISAKVQSLPSSGTFYEPDFGGTYRNVVLALTNTAISGNKTISLTSSGMMSSVQTEIAYDRGVPDTLDDATFLGLPDNNEGSGWAVEFNPSTSPYQLIKAEIYAAFSQEFAGSTTQAGSPKEFLFHVWGDRNGLPGEDLITPFVVKVNRSSFDNAFIEIDLAPFSSQLTNLSGCVYVGFTEDGTLSTSVGLTHPSIAGHSFAYFASAGSWRKMSSLTMEGATSLEGWDLMIRAVVGFQTISSPVPKLIAGITQDPSSSGRFNVVLIGDSELRPESICGTLAQESGTTLLEFFRTTPLRFLSSTATLTSSGATAINLKAARLFGAKYADTSFVFTSAFAGVAGTKLYSPDSLLALTVQSSSSSFHATIFKGTLDTIDQRATSVYTLGPKGQTTFKPSEISLAIAGFDTNLYTPAIYDATRWYSLPFVVANGTLSASTTLLSTFAIVPRKITNGVLRPLVPTVFALRQNYPNPFNPSTTISFDIPSDCNISLKVYDILGREVSTIADGYFTAGSYPVIFDASRLSLASGVYFYRLVAGGNMALKKMVLLR